jgi:hypothetical protein
MVHDRANWLTKMRRVALALTVAALSSAYLDIPVVHAQNVMRSPNLNIQSRIPSINPTIAPRINPSIAGRAATGIHGTGPNVTTTTRPIPRVGVTSTLPNARYSPNLNPACNSAYRGSDGECRDKPVSSADGGKGAGGGSAGNRNGSASRNGSSQTALNLRPIAGELVAEIDGSLSDAQVDALARRHGLVRLESRNFPLIGAAIGLFRITDRRPAETVRRAFAGDASVRSVQLNFRYVLQERKAASTEGDPAQYALAKLRLPQAHTLANGANVTIAVIDSGIDDKHPELVNAIADNFDALGSKEGPHVHGTGIAGAIVSHARLMGSAPQARILGIRAFGVAPTGAESTTFVILKSLDYAVLHGAQIVNMSFAGPKDPLIERGIGATAARGIVMVAASGNAGPKSPPLYPAANTNVIAGQRRRRPGRTVCSIEPRRPYRDLGAGRRYLPARSGRKISDDVRHLVFRRLRQWPRSPDVGA